MDDSSPDLSLKLRRGSSDSRESFYMDFAQGIDSDIEEVTTIERIIPEHPGGRAEGDADTLATPSGLDDKDLSQCCYSIPANNMSGGSHVSRGTYVDSEISGSSAPPLPSPASPGAALVSPETLSRHSSPPPIPAHPTHQPAPSCSSHRVHLESPLRLSRPPSMTLGATLSLQPMLYGPGGGSAQPPLPPTRHIRSSVAIQNMHFISAGDALATTLSALYGKLLVVMGVAFPMAEVISTYIPPSFYEGFYLYLYIGSMVFLLYMYAALLRDRARSAADTTVVATESDTSTSPSESDSCSSRTERSTTTATHMPPHLAGKRLSLGFALTSRTHHYGSFYLRMGAVAFGIGSMIYSGLEFGQYWELERNTNCHNVLLALTPATRMAFIFIQMYFIFLNNEMKVYKHKIVARFGLMHMVGTNLSVWLNVLVQETKHEILTFYDPENKTIGISHRLAFQKAFASLSTDVPPSHPAAAHLRVPRGLKGPHHIFECRRTNIMGSLVQDASPFLFPCTIEYSLICAAILYVMWKNISKYPSKNVAEAIAKARLLEGLAYKKSPHLYSVDCARAHKGLFFGILVLVLTIISLILFFVLISRKEYATLAVVEVNVCELALYAMTTFASLAGMVCVRNLKYDGNRNLELDNILLVGAQTGMFIYGTFTIIGGHFTIEKNTILILITALSSLVQTTCQTMFILDASRRSAKTPEQLRKKPGREIVTFLLVTNLAMWAINTLEKSRAESHPVQLHFYGLWAWTIITHVSMPLAIFYRFHSTVCLCEIWKRAYKMKPAYM
ncbi:proton channel OtopLc-like isoform X1 [Maniola jurtina]|uniref:proton channel OtopLc-like isoform X1 n=2 Tax=Maniola jurtina TaxID=191418 RepID=UPI001E6860FC|nr:proton channel OtopLc-like isoform X1 [Maniola jurtina]XP_045763795.1 proton channel OtopLc-like isoform X1 [Maniola jurtina]XP_045763796.1 proton channel OtopLc-like isoform X1 [Maniola jurtina]XP_045763797.1 proton channel OtopLc-like isoform X1 [Maniola jurtina]XP_045763798.1 proton channel OtopLc-like isoform X1 [Maniola jurtina]XP_045763799.1 proton channel OtopLc-like isoform X1 [Maniola jurtina]XP_045763800.1 proton channel OtopLc-like isoform X1 [Maniola jurtina]